MKKITAVLALLILLMPVVAWAMYKPVRILAPEWVANITCAHPDVCTDDPGKFHEAYKLYESALKFVAESVGPFHNNPRVVFCSTEACFRSFGFRKAFASTVGKWGIVISPRGWKDYYIRHEMIHHRQAEELSEWDLVFDPEWLIEGMAYSLSGDPRERLSDRWQQDRSEFEAWFKRVGKENLWKEAGRY